MPFAEGTTVSPERSKAEIEGLLRRYGASEFASGWSERGHTIGFRCRDRYVRFDLAIPPVSDKRFTPRPSRRRWNSRLGAAQQIGGASREQLHEAEVRRVWRALALVIKAKLEAVQTGITTFENEFMAHILLPDGKTVGQHVSPALAAAYQTGQMPRLLPAPGGAS